MMSKIYLVKTWVDDGWQRFTTKHKVLASNEQRAKELVTRYWLDKDSTNLVEVLDVKELTEFIEGVIC